jgi:hypothetical protein
MTISRIAIIGSFRQHYDVVLTAIGMFREAGLEVTSPLGAEIIKPDIDFVRFTSDPEGDDDPTVQSVTLRRIFSADMTYVVAPEGYVGRTTCYEIGRLVQARTPVYFSERPNDLPLNVSDRWIATPKEVVARFITGREQPQWLFSEDDHPSYLIERELVQ